ncbi:MAG: hypothetical protein WCL18_09210 [bacterium]
MRKYGRWIYAGAGLILSLLVAWLITTFVVAIFMSYFFLLFGILGALYGKTGNS